MRDGVIYSCPNYAVCGTVGATGKCSKACITRYNQEMGGEIKTNGDRIRAMSDEELATFAAEKIVNLENHKMVEQGYTPTATQLATLGNTMHDILLRWLRSSVKGE